jgi:hypothetical protein
VDVTLNVLLFIPVGAGLALAGARWRRALAIVALTTLGIETLQLVAIAGRDASLSDLLTNCSGGAIGFALGRSWRSLVFPDRALARGLALVACVAWLAALAFGGFAMSVSLPRAPWWAQVTPSYRPFVPFEGHVLHASLGGTAMPSDVLGDVPRLRAELLNGAPARIVATTAFASGGVAPMLRVVGGDTRREVLLIGQRRSDLVVRIGMRAARLRFRTPAFEFPRLLAGPRGDTAVIESAIVGGVVRVTVERRGVRTTREIALSPAWGWSLLTPAHPPIGGMFALASALWLAALAAPLGYWCSVVGTISGARARWMCLAMAMMSIGMLGAPRVFGMQPMGWWEWGGAALGVAVAWALGAVASGRARRQERVRAAHHAWIGAVDASGDERALLRRVTSSSGRLTSSS